MVASVLTGCSTSQKETVAPAATTPVVSKPKTPSFVPPTADQAYRLQDDCTRRGKAILHNNVIGPVLTQEQVSRYNPTTNRCYVRLEIHAMNLREWDKYDNSAFLEDGQTEEMLAYYTHKPGGQIAYFGFGCSDVTCVEGKVADCMNGKECEPQ
jgi:hypothetical protein